MRPQPVVDNSNIVLDLHLACLTVIARLASAGHYDRIDPLGFRTRNVDGVDPANPCGEIDVGGQGQLDLFAKLGLVQLANGIGLG